MMDVIVSQAKYAQLLYERDNCARKIRVADVLKEIADFATATRLRLHRAKCARHDTSIGGKMTRTRVVMAYGKVLRRVSTWR